MEKTGKIELKELDGRKKRRKRSLGLPARPAVPVRGLWEAATEEERLRAQEMGMALLEYWTGRASKEETAEQLKIPTLRVWQLSQQATSGMLAGLLVQPKRWKREDGVEMENVKELKARVKELEEMVEGQNVLIAVMRTMPGMREVQEPKEGWSEEDRGKVPERVRQVCRPKSERKAMDQRRKEALGGASGGKSKDAR
jgi:hypothetical protein